MQVDARTSFLIMKHQLSERVDELVGGEVRNIDDTILDDTDQSNGCSEDVVRWENGTRGHRKNYNNTA